VGKYRHNPDIALYDRSYRESLQTLQDGAGLSENRTNQKHTNTMTTYQPNYDDQGHRRDQRERHYTIGCLTVAAGFVLIILIVIFA